MRINENKCARQDQLGVLWSNKPNQPRRLRRLGGSGWRGAHEKRWRKLLLGEFHKTNVVWRTRKKIFMLLARSEEQRRKKIEVAPFHFDRAFSSWRTPGLKRGEFIRNTQSAEGTIVVACTGAWYA